jgi:hypothetical protein
MYRNLYRKNYPIIDFLENRHILAEYGPRLPKIIIKSLTPGHAHNNGKGPTYRRCSASTDDPCPFSGPAILHVLVGAGIQGRLLPGASDLVSIPRISMKCSVN